MRYLIFTLFAIFLVTVACEKSEGDKERIITVDIVGKWWTLKGQDSIIHDYSRNGKLILQKYQSQSLKYTGYFNYDIDNTNMEYWGENTDGICAFEVYFKDTLYLANFLGSSYSFIRIPEL